MKDANGTGFLLLLGPRDWEAALAAPGSTGLAWEGAAGGVALAPKVARFPPRTGAARLTPADRRGADMDRFGNLYWIGADRRTIRTARPGREAWDWWSLDAPEPPAPPAPGGFAPVPPSTPRRAATRLAGLAVTSRHHLIVGARSPEGLLIFDLHQGGPPERVIWPAALALRVFDIDAEPAGGAWLLDRSAGPDGAGPRLFRLDDRLRLAPLDGLVEIRPPEPSDFAPEGAAPEPLPAETVPAGLPLGPPAPDGTPGAAAPVAVAGLSDGTALVLDAPPAGVSRLLRYGAGGLLAAAPLAALLPPELTGSPPALRGHDLAFLPDPTAPAGEIRGALALVDDQGDQAFRLTLSADAAAPGLDPGPRLELALAPDFLPLRRFGGRALIATPEGVRYDLEERWTLLAADPRRRRESEGSLGPLRFDSGTPGTLWGRLTLDACLPPVSAPGAGRGLPAAETAPEPEADPAPAALLLEMRAAEDEATLAATPWTPLPAPYRRGDGAEIPFWTPFEDPESAARGAGTWETLPPAARGRLAEIRIAFSGDGRATPRIRALRLRLPRASWLERYLPGLYREDEVSADFLDRFLANLEGIATPLEDRVAEAQGLFDTRTAPAERLDWLAGWLGGELGPDWDDARRRLFIDHAELLFRWRGTPAGLKAMIDLATDPCPSPALFDGLRSGRPAEPDAARRGVRLAEGWARRAQGGAPSGAGGAWTLRPDDPDAAPWTPADGAAPLHAAFADFAVARRGGLPALSTAWGRTPPFAARAEIRFAPLPPDHPGEAEDWRAFISTRPGARYAEAGAEDAPLWRALLARRHARLSRLAAAHQLPATPARWEDVALPAALPDGGAALVDWIDFVAEVLPVARGAHRFTVLAPADPAERREDRAERLARIAEVAARERPAHAAFEVQPFWALFQAGSARLGIDTTLGAGARFAAIELGRSALGEGFLGYGHPRSVTDRAVTGRDAAGEMRL